MAFLSAHAVDGGRLPAAMLRREAWTSAGGRNGVARGPDLAVRAASVPGSQVRIMPGGGIVCDGYVVGEAYSVANGAADGDAVVDVPATGSGGGRTDYLGIRVDDPAFGGQVPEDPLAATYCRPLLRSSLDGLDFPFLPLARIDIPASTATITQDMITDLRELVKPNRLDYKRLVNLPNGAPEENVTTTWRRWPDAAYWMFRIPEWASKAQVVAHIAGARISGTNGQGAYGKLRIEHGQEVSGETEWNETVGAHKDSWTSMCVWDMQIPKDHRGGNKDLMLRAIKSGGDATASAAWGTAVSIEVTYLEEPDQQYWEG